MKIKQNEIIHKDLFFKVKEIDEEKYIIRGVFSSEVVDRQGEIIDQLGWKLDEYMTNPVVLFAHDQYTPAIGQMVELAVDTIQKQLVGAIKFAVDEFELAKTIFNLYKGRYMRAFSAGFRNELTEIETDENGEEKIVLRKNTLYEMSCVNVPANAMALAIAKGINIDPVKEAIKKIKNEKAEKALLNNKIELSQETIQKISDNLYQMIQKELSANTADGKKEKKVETPISKGGSKFASIRQINKAVRQLLKEKEKIEKI